MGRYSKDQANSKAIYGAFLWHGLFLALTMAMIDFNTVLPSLIDELTSSSLVFGLIYSIMLGAPLAFNIIFSHYLQRVTYKKKYLLIGIYLRAIAFLGMAIFTYYFGKTSPSMTLISFFGWVFLFSISGGFAGIAYTDLVGKLISRESRGKFFATKQFVSSGAAFTGGLIVAKIFALEGLTYPNNYALTLLIGFIGLFIASLGFWLLKEPKTSLNEVNKRTIKEHVLQVPIILKKDRDFSRFIVIENLASFSLMILPFYMVYAKEAFGVDASYIGKYLVFQIIGTIFSNVIWGGIASRYKAKNVVRLCILLGASIPLIALAITPLGEGYFVIVFLLVGFVISGRKVGFESYLLDLAPNEQRISYLGIRGTLNIFVVLLPVLGGFFIDVLGFAFTFSLVSGVMFGAFLLLKDRQGQIR